MATDSLAKKVSSPGINVSYAAVETRHAQLPDYLSRDVRGVPPIAVVSTHPMLYHDYEVVTWARRLGIQTLGVVKSWDNIQKGLSSHCHLLSVWNPINREEALRLLHYRSDEVTMNGALSLMRLSPGVRDGAWKRRCP
ncbi:MAG: hypothetical protein IPJ55_17405 [Chloracidobacterium sp.]|nr:hypothetical protein [Chloracidobacterium sp.]